MNYLNYKPHNQAIQLGSRVLIRCTPLVPQ